VPGVASVQERAPARREGGREFQALGPDEQKDRSPTVRCRSLPVHIDCKESFLFHFTTQLCALDFVLSISAVRFRMYNFILVLAQRTADTAQATLRSFH